jgi:hypothetical protein
LDEPVIVIDVNCERGPRPVTLERVGAKLNVARRANKVLIVSIKAAESDVTQEFDRDDAQTSVAVANGKRVVVAHVGPIGLVV